MKAFFQTLRDFWLLVWAAEEEAPDTDGYGDAPLPRRKFLFFWF